MAGKTGVMPSNPDGSCIYLKDNKCSVYENRPFICNVEKMYQLRKNANLLPVATSKIDYFKMNTEKCNEMIKSENLDKKFLLDLSKYDGLQ
jgi:Fe-S-cluster containining protein